MFPIEQLISNTLFFRGFSRRSVVVFFSEYLKDIIRNCGQVTFDKDDIIIKQGDQGNW